MLTILRSKGKNMKGEDEEENGQRGNRIRLSSADEASEVGSGQRSQRGKWEQ